MATLDDIRRHVLDDAQEIAAVAGLVTPLLETDFDETEFAVERFLRQFMCRYLPLILTRLYASPQKNGRTGHTACISALLDTARDAGNLSARDYERFVLVSVTSKRDLEQREVPFSDLMEFRNSELAHSLHRHSQAKLGLAVPPVLAFAIETVQLVKAIDDRLVQSG